jgi:hypothetical protein
MRTSQLPAFVASLLWLGATLPGCGDDTNPVASLTEGGSDGGLSATLPTTSSGSVTATTAASETASGTASSTTGETDPTTTGATDPTTTGATDPTTTGATDPTTTGATDPTTTGATDPTTTGATDPTTTGATDPTTTGATDPTTTGATDPTTTGATDPTTTGATDPTTGATTGVEPCATENPMVSFDPPNIVYVLDKSGSMDSNSFTLPGGGTANRWQVLWDVVNELTNAYDPQVNFGVVLFPTGNTSGACAVNPPGGLTVIPDPNRANDWMAIEAAIPGRNTNITGDTPGLAGLRVAGDWLIANRPNDANAIVFILDGGINCGQSATDTTNQIATYANTNGIPTYVVGIDIDPGSGTFDNMESYAQASGVPAPGNTFYNGTSGQQLRDALDGIIGAIATCRIDLSTDPPFPELVDVVVDGTRYPYDATIDCATQDGWQYVPGSNNRAIELCGAACTDFKALQTPSADVEYFCVSG